MSKKVIMSAVVAGVIGLSGLAYAGHHEGGEAKEGHKQCKKGGHHMMEKYDMDKDGAISKEEIMKVTEERFTKMDADHDGKVTQDEAKTYYHAKHEAMKAKMKEHHGDDHGDAHEKKSEEH